MLFACVVSVNSQSHLGACARDARSSMRTPLRRQRGTGRRAARQEGKGKKLNLPPLSRNHRRRGAPARAAMSTIVDAVGQLGKGAAVAGTAMWVVLSRLSDASLVGSAGAVGATVCGAVVKGMVGQSRPKGSGKIDSGMPSTHAVAYGFLASYMGLHSMAGVSAPLGKCVATGLQALAVAFSAQRVLSKDHTLAQVAVGYLMGAAFAAACWLFFLPLVAETWWPWLAAALGAAIIAFKEATGK